MVQYLLKSLAQWCTKPLSFQICVSNPRQWLTQTTLTAEECQSCISVMQSLLDHKALEDSAGIVVDHHHPSHIIGHLVDHGYIDDLQHGSSRRIRLTPKAASLIKLVFPVNRPFALYARRRHLSLDDCCSDVVPLSSSCLTDRTDWGNRSIDPCASQCGQWSLLPAFTMQANAAMVAYGI